jgi:hypothetical protein
VGTVAQALATSSTPAGQHLVAEHPTQGHGDDEGADAHWYNGSEMVQWLIMAEEGVGRPDLVINGAVAQAAVSFSPWFSGRQHCSGWKGDNAAASFTPRAPPHHAGASKPTLQRKIEGG